MWKVLHQHDRRMPVVLAAVLVVYRRKYYVARMSSVILRSWQRLKCSIDLPLLPIARAWNA
jgi:hypothetical protein